MLVTGFWTSLHVRHAYKVRPLGAFNTCGSSNTCAGSIPTGGSPWLGLLSNTGTVAIIKLVVASALVPWMTRNLVDVKYGSSRTGCASDLRYQKSLSLSQFMFEVVTIVLGPMFGVFWVSGTPLLTLSVPQTAEPGSVHS